MSRKPSPSEAIPLWACEPHPSDYLRLPNSGPEGDRLALRRTSEAELRSYLDLLQCIAQSRLTPDGERRPLNFLMLAKLLKATHEASKFWSREVVVATVAHHWEWLEWGILYVIRVKTGRGAIKIGRTNDGGFFKRLEMHRRDFGDDIEPLFLGVTPMHTFAERLAHDDLSDFRVGGKELFEVDAEAAIEAVKNRSFFGVAAAAASSEHQLARVLSERRAEFAPAFGHMLQVILPGRDNEAFVALESSREAARLVKETEKLWAAAQSERQRNPILTWFDPPPAKQRRSRASPNR